MSKSIESRRSLAVIIARGGSKGIPKKNLQPVGGIPLVAHIIKTAIKVSDAIPLDVIFSTDCEEIKTAALNAGAWCPFLRPSELAQDHVPSLPVVQHALLQAETIKNITYKNIIYLQPTAPLTRPEDILSCIEALDLDLSLESSLAVVEADVHPFRMKRMLEGGRIINYIDQGFEDMRPRQVLPKVYRRAGSIYASRRHVITEKQTLIGDPCKGIIVPPETAIDIDTKISLDLARLLYDKNHSQQ